MLQLVGLGEHDLVELGAPVARNGVALGEQDVQVSLDRRQRCPQLVGHRGHEVLLGLFQPSFGGPHSVLGLFASHQGRFQHFLLLPQHAVPERRRVPLGDRSNHPLPPLGELVRGMAQLLWNPQQDSESSREAAGVGEVRIDQSRADSLSGLGREGSADQQGVQLVDQVVQQCCDLGGAQRDVARPGNRPRPCPGHCGREALQVVGGIMHGWFPLRAGHAL